MGLNVVALSGKVNHKFDTRTTDKGTKHAAFQLLYMSGEYKKYVNVTAFGDRSVPQVESVDVGDEVIVQGQLNESRWKIKVDGVEKDPVEWDGRTEITLYSLTKVSVPELVAAGSDAGPWG